MKKKILMLTGFVLAPIIVFSMELDYFQLIEKIKENNNYLKIYKTQIQIGKSQLNLANAYKLPTIYYQGIYNKTDIPMYSFGHILNQGEFNQKIDFNNPGEYDNYSNRAYIQMPIYNKGDILITAQQAKENYEATGFDYENMQNHIIEQAGDLYFDYFKLKNYEKVYIRAIEGLKEHKNTAEQLFENGIVVKSDVLNVEVKLKEAETEKNKIINNQKIILAYLNELLAENNNKIELVFQKLDLDALTKEEFIDIALKKNPQIKKALKQVRLAELEIKKARQKYYPSLNLQASYGYDDDNLNFDRASKNIAIVSQIDIFDFGKIKYKIKIAKHNYENAKTNLEAKKAGIISKINDLYYNLDTAKQNISVAQKAVGSAEESLRIIKTRYENQTDKITDLLDARTNLTKSEQMLASAKIDYQKYLLDLYIYSNNLDNFFKEGENK